MKILTAFLTAITLLAFGSATFACDGMRTKQQAASSDEAPILPQSSTS